MLPSFPYEITEKILKIATLDVVREERRNFTLVGQANAFLLSASLVSHTWRNIAQSLLVRHGLVDPSRVHPFISELGRQGVVSTLHTMRIGLAAGGRPVPVRNNEATLAEVNLESIHIEAATDESLATIFLPEDTLNLSDIVSLAKLATHLRLLEDSADCFPPSLTALKILRDAGSDQTEWYFPPKYKILSLVSNLSALKELEVPDCWRSDEVEEACEARGIVLTWSSAGVA
ncbi:hypothetical protein RQP46_010507 [Phenoliferia psychrophenolica]